MRISDFLDEYPAEERLPKLAAGSWINANFYTWIGHHEDVFAWEAVFAAREVIEKAAESGASPEAVAAAREELYIAEGSDWYWWFGDDHSSEQDDVFDSLFRSHVSNVYRLLDVEPPMDLYMPIKAADEHAVFKKPAGMLKVSVDGRVSSFFEWLGAGHYDNRKAQGAMEKASYFISDVRFGSDRENFFLRIDFTGQGRKRFAEGAEIKVAFVEPEMCTLAVRGGNTLEILACRAGGKETRTGSACMDRVLEVACPLEALGVRGPERAAFIVQVETDGRPVEKIPMSGALFFDVT